MANEARRKPVVSITLSRDSIEILRRAANGSEYVERLLRAFPPPRIGSIADLSRLIKARHPWVTNADRIRGRQGLPTFGGDVPHRPGAASWSPKLVLGSDGTMYNRSEWESEAID